MKGTLNWRRIQIPLAILLLACLAGYLYLNRADFPSTESVEPIAQSELPLTRSKLYAIKHGYVFVDYLNLNEYALSDNGLRTRIAILDTKASTTKLLYAIPNARERYPADQFHFNRGQLYFVNNQGQLQRFKEDFTEVETLSIGLKTGEFISGYLIEDEYVYYLAGPFCYEYGGKCDGTLRRANVITNEVKDIAYSISYTSIAGFDRSHTSLYVVYSSGDAGCFSTRFAKVDLAKGTVNESPTYFGCSEGGGGSESEFDKAYGALEAFQETLIPKRKTVHHLEWSNGSLHAPTTEVTPQGEAYWWPIEIY